MQQNLLNFNEGLPFNVSILNSPTMEYHFHKELELIFVLKGKVIYLLDGKKYTLNKHDIFWVNSLYMHSIICEPTENILLSFHINPYFFDSYYENFSNYYFNFDENINSENNPIYNLLVSNIAKVILANLKQESNYKLESLNSILEISLILLKNFKCEVLSRETNTTYKRDRIYSILKYIENNYHDNDLSLKSISEEMHITPQYISKFFKENLGIGFIDYINKLRVNKSLPSLLKTKKSILDIAIENGFNDHKAYNRIFKKEFKMTASEYKNSYKENQSSENDIKLKYLNDNSKSYFKYLFNFINNNISNTSDTSSSEINIHKDLTSFYNTPFKKYWSEITSIGRASLCLRHEVRKQIETAKKDLGFKYIRFHGLFSDEMMVYKENTDGEPIYSWIYIDEIFDFFLRIGIKPFIEIGFMPEALASKKQHTPFLWNANVSYPNSLKKWTKLVQSFISHCISRYGENEVQSWYFQIWNAPNLESIFWFEKKEKFFEFYKETYFAIKKINKNIIIGTPGVPPTQNFSWLNDFFKYCDKHSITLDFVACNIYGYTDPQNKSIPSNILQKSTDNENIIQNSLNHLNDILNDYNLNSLKIFITEWNLSPYSYDYNRDTCFLSSFITYSILNNLNTIDSIIFWNLSDILEEGLTESNLFHGGLGLFTYNSLKKPAYNAFLLLNKLGDILIDKSENYIITSKNNNYQILLYNFVYFDNLFLTGDKSLLSYHSRYNIFENSNSSLNIKMILSLESGTYKIKKYFLNRNSGSIFDSWIDMGSPEEIETDIYSYLKSREIPNITIETKIIKNNLIISENVAAHAITFIEVEKIN